MERITISSSLKYRELIRQAVLEVSRVGLVGLFPNLDSSVTEEDVDLKYMKQLETEHFEAIDSSEGLYVICPNGYVGILVSVEIGYAHGRGKPVFFSEVPKDLGLQAMVTDYVPLGDLAKLRTR